MPMPLKLGRKPLRTLKFGKLPVRYSPLTLKLSNYVDSDPVPVPPAVSYWDKSLNYWGMDANDQVGDCTIAAAAHMVMLWTHTEGYEYIPNNGQCISNYSVLSGYNPATGANDNGCVVLDVLNYWKSPGMFGSPIEGYASINLGNNTLARQAVFLFGGIYIGFNFPQSAMDQFNSGQPWDVVSNDGGIIGGHAVPLLGYDSTYLYAVTWGAIQPMTWAFYGDAGYVDESYAVLSPNWFNAAGRAPSGYNVAQLRADLGLLGKGPKVMRPVTVMH